ncbi:MAG: hypothetical protein Q7S55_04605 [Nanoarchaeota archaeon]|nr:hypothetical protein [Nanoarchaeota archaeon]
MKDERRWLSGVLIAVFLITSLFLTAGCTQEDPCQTEFEQCNYDCGEGVFSSICKEKCTYNYNKCKEGNR